MKVPLVDLGRQHVEIAAEVSEGMSQVITDTAFIQGSKVGEFEEAFASFSEVRHCIGVGSGTDALELAIRALGIGHGDEVIVPTNSFIASALAVVRAGATPVLVDCDPATYLVDLDSVERAITAKTRAVMPVHLYGQIAPVELLRDVVGDLPIIEDGAQSQGARRLGHQAGSLGDVAATSFYPGKNIGAYGDAGAVLTSDDDLAAEVRRMGNWGSDEKYLHPTLGFNSRLDTLQAAVLIPKLERLPEWNEQRAAAAKVYDDLLDDLPVVLPTVLDGNQHVWHLYVIRVPGRDQVLARLHEAGVGAGVHYPTPMHLQGALSALGYGFGSFPVAEALASEILSLPMFPGITLDEQEFVVESLTTALGEQSG